LIHLAKNAQSALLVNVETSKTQHSHDVRGMEALDQSDEPEITLSIVVPLLNEAPSLEELYQQISDALLEYGLDSYEVLFVDDGSTDSSWEVISSLSENHPEVFGVRLHRNYGKSTALHEGFRRVRGAYVATMDADLQDDPREVPQMLQQLQDEELDLISGWKKERYDPLTKTIPSRFFNAVTSWVTGINLHDFNCGLKVYRREVTDHVALYGELHRYIPLLAHWEGYERISEKVVQHHPRKYGHTKFGINRFLRGFLDLITLMFVENYSQRPMHFFGGFGLLFLVIGGLINTYLAALKIFYGQNLSDRPLLLFGVMLMVLGAQFFSIGFIGELFVRDRQEQKRPNIRDEC
jgi:glycosyltransferase involved in cell wall biosynthesis